jgi:hypothetical protein
MAFLLPAVVALFCDICVVWLSSYAQHHDAATHSKSHWFYYTTDVYCGSLPAATRLFILCVPLLYHSYTGTALRHGLWYQTIYIGMTLLVVVHAVAYLLINPQSFESIFILPSRDPEYEYRRLWLILWFSTISLISHNFLIRHVRSTAPTPPMMLRMLNQPRNHSRGYLCRSYIRNTVQPTMYFAVRTAVAATQSAVAASYPPPNGATASSLRSRGTACPRPEEPSWRNSADEDDAATEEPEQEPALMHAMNGM